MSFVDPTSSPTAALPASISFLQTWHPLVLGGGVVIIAWLINSLAPQKRARIRRVVILYALYLTCFGAALGLKQLESSWSENFRLGGVLIESFTIVNLLAIGIFDLLLPKLRIALVSITSDIVVGIAYIVTAFGALRSAGMDPSSLLTTSAVVGGVLTLSLQTTIGNILGGVALQLDGSIHVGDWLQLDNGRQGLVKEIRWRHTVLETRDWDTIIVPNAALLSSNIIILGKRSGQPLLHRMTVPFNVDYRFAPNHVMDVVTEGLQAAPIHGVSADPPPFAFCYDFAKDPGRDSFGYYAARYWLSDLPNDDAANSRVRARVYSALRRAGIPLARPVSTTFFAPEEDEETRGLRHRERRAKVLGGLPLFKSLTADEIGVLAQRLEPAPFSAGETVMRKGAVAHSLYILTVGRVDVLASANGGPSKVVATIQAPDVFGEMGLMTGEARSADVVARSEIQCYRLDKDDFEAILSNRPEIAEAMAKMLAHRRVELDAIRDGLDADARSVRERNEQQRILGRIQHFFGLEK